MTTESEMMMMYLETNTDEEGRRGLRRKEEGRRKKEEEKGRRIVICYPCSSTILTTTLQLVCDSNEVDSTSDHSVDLDTSLPQHAQHDNKYLFEHHYHHSSSHLENIRQSDQLPYTLFFY